MAHNTKYEIVTNSFTTHIVLAISLPFSRGTHIGRGAARRLDEAVSEQFHVYRKKDTAVPLFLLACEIFGKYELKANEALTQTLPAIIDTNVVVAENRLKRCPPVQYS